MTALLPLTDETPGEYIVVARVSEISRVPMAPVHTTFGAANAEARKLARSNPGMEVAVFQMRVAHTTILAGKGDEA